MTRLPLTILALATTLAAAPWPQHGRVVGDEARRVMGGAEVAIGAHRYGTCATLTGAVVDAARADGLEARGLLWDAPDDPDRPDTDMLHVTPAVRLPDGRWCGYDYWSGGTRYRCSMDLRTDPAWWSRVACCRRGMKHLGAVPEEEMDKYRKALDLRRSETDPGHRTARRALREMQVERRGRSGWMGDP